MWTPTTRRQHSRTDLRYGSDVTDAEWEILAPFLPGEAPCGRERVGREASPAAAVIDSQSVKTTESGGLRGFDVGKKIKGRKRHAMVDTDGRALKLHVHAADIQDRDGARPLLRASRPRWPFVKAAFADGRWVVERFFAWISRNRRLAKDVEATIKPAEAFLYAASAILLIRRLAR
jgi:putative transposase